MNFAVMWSLKQIALQKVAIALWGENEVRKLMSKAFVLGDQSDRVEVFTESIEIVRKKLFDLPLPEQLKKELIGFVGPIGFQLYMWVDYHRCCGFVENSPTTFHFTTHGTVDNKAMAEMLVQDPSIDVVKRFKLACTYSLVPQMHTLWEQLPDETYKDLTQVQNDSRLVSFWVHCLAGKASQLNEVMRDLCETDSSTLSEYAFLAATVSGNLTSTRYFLQKLTLEEKERTLLKAALYITKDHQVSFRNISMIPNSYYADVLCLLLSLMNEQQQLQLFKNRPCQTLMCFLDWPLATRFLELFERMYHFLRPEEYPFLLIKITDKMFEGYKDENYKKLFAIVWHRITGYI